MKTVFRVRDFLPLAALTTALCLPGWAQSAAKPISVPLDPRSGPPAPDSGLMAEEAVKLSAKGTFAAARAAVGDTIEYLLRVEWKDARVPVVVLPPESLETPGFRIAGQSAAHRKSAQGGTVGNVTEFSYQLVPKAPGNAKVAPLKLRYLTGLSSREEFLYVPGAFLDIVPARVPLYARLWFRILAGLAALTALAFGGWRFTRAHSEKRRKAREAATHDFSPEVRALRGRWNSADSKTWIEDAEKICAAWLGHQLGSAPAAGRFDALLDTYLSRQKPAAPEADGWARLRELFHHARYAGGRKEPHELQDAYRVLKTCLQIPGEPDT
jgi:hypothetical protein